MTNMFKTQLTDYAVWWDGDIEVSPERLKTYISKVAPGHLYVSDDTAPAVVKYNSVAPTPIVKKESLNEDVIDTTLRLPQEYASLEVLPYLKSLENSIERDDLYHERVKRLRYEIEIFRLRDLLEIVRLLKYVIDVMTHTGSVWGVGRGSSCSSYILFLMGLHSVDVVRYDIDLHDFIR